MIISGAPVYLNDTFRETVALHLTLDTLSTSQLGQFISENQRWAWIAQIVSGAGELGIQVWQRYECTGETAFLEVKAYPFLKGTVEFYRMLPSMTKEEDGLDALIWLRGLPTPTNHEGGYYRATRGREYRRFHPTMMKVKRFFSPS